MDEIDQLIKAIINKFWNNERLQNAIQEYGEWNRGTLNEVKDSVIREILDRK